MNSEDRDTAARWDDFAAEYYAMQQADSLPLASTVEQWLSAQKILPAAQVLDLGSGAGRFSPMLAQHAQQLTITDISGEMLDFAQLELHRQGLTATTVQLPWDEFYRQPRHQYDVIFAHMAPFLQVDDFPRLAALLTPTGVFVLSRIVGRTDVIFDQFLAAFPTLRVDYVVESPDILQQWQTKGRQDGWSQRHTQLTFDYSEEIDRDFLHDELAPLLTVSQQNDLLVMLDRIFQRRATIMTHKTLTLGIVAFTLTGGHFRL